MLVAREMEVRRWGAASRTPLETAESFGGLRGSFSVAVVAAKLLLLTAYLLQARPPK